MSCYSGKNSNKNNCYQNLISHFELHLEVILNLNIFNLKFALQWPEINDSIDTEFHNNHISFDFLVAILDPPFWIVNIFSSWVSITSNKLHATSMDDRLISERPAIERLSRVAYAHRKLVHIDRLLPHEITWQHLRCRHTILKRSVLLLSDSSRDKIEWKEYIGMKRKKHLHYEWEMW